MRFVTRASVAVAGLAATVALAGCGSSGGTLLSADAASALTADLTQASRALSLGNCQLASSALVNFKSDVAQLTSVNSTLLRILNQGADTISGLSDKRCPTGESTTTTTDSTTTTTSTSTTTTSETESTPTVTTTPAETITTVTSDTSGGATPGQTSTPADTDTTPAASTSTPDSGGAGLGSGGGAGIGGTGNTP